MKKVLLWEDESRFQYEEKNLCLLINPEDIEQKIDLSNEKVYMFPELEPTEENEKMLESLLPQLNECEDYYEIQEIPELEGMAVELADDSETSKHILCYFSESKNIGYLDDCESVPVYGYHNGSNWKEIWFNDAFMTEYEVIYDNEQMANLDEWDGDNWSYKGRFNHGRKYPIIEIDGEKVVGKYLIEEWSQWQGSLPTGEIVEE